MLNYSQIDMLTGSRLEYLLDYDPETGIFTRKIGTGGELAGTRAGKLNLNGYRHLGIDGHMYGEHRVAFLWMTGRWPEPECDHRDLNKSNNAWHNLRESTRGQNNSNKGLLPSNTSGHSGVYLHKKSNRWCAYLRHKDVNMYLGAFIYKEDAIAARKAAEIKYHGDFANQGRVE